MSAKVSKRILIYSLTVVILLEMSLLLFFFKSNEEKKKSVVCPENVTQEQCWNDELTMAIKEHGITEGMKVFDRLYASEKKFVNDCHSYAHTLGKESYEIYGSNYKKILYSNNMVICGYGFFHGLLEVVTAKSGELREVRNFCNMFREDGKKGRNYYECYHGVGHGAVARHEGESSVSPEESVSQALKTCESITDTQREMEFCARGIFMRSYSELVSKSSQKASLVKSLGILASCDGQVGDYAKWCYQAQGRFLLVSENDNFESAASHLKRVRNIEFKKTAIYEMAISMSKSKGTRSIDQQIGLCQSVERMAIQSCLNGLIAGTLLYHQTQSDIRRSDEICKSESMDEIYREGCVKEIQNALAFFTQE